MRPIDADALKDFIGQQLMLTGSTAVVMNAKDFFENIVDNAPTIDVPERKAEGWDMFELITSVYFGKQYYFLQDDGLVYSRSSHKYMTEDAAITEFLNAIGE